MKMVSFSINNNFRLKGLRILPNYNGKSYHDIINEVEDTILDFDMDEIEIQQELNPKFEPTDLFIRLNNKPYPIKQNSFEMWNSTCDRDVRKDTAIGFMPLCQSLMITENLWIECKMKS